MSTRALPTLHHHNNMDRFRSLYLAHGGTHKIIHSSTLDQQFSHCGFTTTATKLPTTKQQLVQTRAVQHLHILLEINHSNEVISLPPDGTLVLCIYM